MISYDMGVCEFQLVSRTGKSAENPLNIFKDPHCEAQKQDHETVKANREDEGERERGSKAGLGWAGMCLKFRRP